MQGSLHPHLWLLRMCYQLDKMGIRVWIAQGPSGATRGLGRGKQKGAVTAVDDTERGWGDDGRNRPET